MIPDTVKIIIAEDEPIILKNIAKKVGLAAENIHITGKVQSSREALSLMEKEIPDILITDIEMPGMNGLELIREVRSKYPQIHILIISGYSNFEYARTALQYGVDNYLLKPVLQEDLNSQLAKMMKKISAEKQQHERNILSKTLQGDITDNLIPSSFSDEGFLLLLLTLGNPVSLKANLTHADEIASLGKRIDYNAFFQDCGFDHFWLIDESCPLQKFIILHTDNINLNPERTARQFLSYIESVLPFLQSFVMANSSLISYSKLGASARQMRTEFPLYCSPFYRQHIMYPESSKCEILLPLKKKEQTDLLYQLQNPSAFLQYVQTTLSFYEKEHFALQSFNDFLSEIFHALPFLFHLNEADCIHGLQQFLEMQYNVPGFTAFCELLQKNLQQLIHSSASIGTENLSLKLKSYMEQNYAQKITMDDLSDLYGYTSSYINRLFKKEYGTSPLQYQTYLRMEKAKELLNTQPDMDIKVIASAIGYDDARYFSRVFKNETGVAPSDYSG